MTPHTTGIHVPGFMSWMRTFHLGTSSTPVVCRKPRIWPRKAEEAEIIRRAQERLRRGSSAPGPIRR